MGRPRTFQQLETEYQEKYGEYPETQEELLAYLEKTLNLDWDKVREEEERIRSIPWKQVRITLPVIPMPSVRPRTSTRGGFTHFYVPGARLNKKIIQEYVNEAKIICTRVDFRLRTFQPTPISSMRKMDVYLAEKGLIRPIQNPDFDNLAKTYSDMIQGVLLLNDNIVNPGKVDKFWSIKPRVEFVLRYQDTWDSIFNERKMKSTKRYQEWFEK